VGDEQLQAAAIHENSCAKKTRMALRDAWVRQEYAQGEEPAGFLFASGIAKAASGRSLG
jgi:hypothetical protein